MCDLLTEAINGKLSSASQEQLCSLLTDYVRTGELHLPSPSSYLKRLRDEQLLVVYGLLGEPSHVVFYRLFKQAERPPAEGDVIGRMLHQVWLLNERYGLPVPSMSTVKRAVA